MNRDMKMADPTSAKSWFHVLQTTKQSQLAVMKLEPGQSSGEKGNEHPDSDQVLIVLEGEVIAEVGTQQSRLTRGQAVIVPAGTSHQFRNEGKAPAVTWNVYAPPAYEQDETA